MMKSDMSIEKGRPAPKGTPRKPLAERIKQAAKAKPNLRRRRSHR
jgi:hypothetical protein